MVMKIVQRQMLAVIAAACTISAFVVPTGSSSAFVGHFSANVNNNNKGNNMRMDMERAGPFGFAARLNLNKLIKQDNNRPTTNHNIESTSVDSVDEAEAEHGMPWTSSIDPKVKDSDLLYMPFWNFHMNFMKEKLTNLKVESCSNGKTDFSFKENGKKKARIVNLCFSSDEYRKIRLTYYDAGDNTQVFNAVMYPDPKYNLPVLGVDLLAFNRKKYLTIVDFQPLHDKEEDHASLYQDKILKPIKEKYDNLKGQMSSKFYDETQFFSKQMLFARFEDENIIQKELFPAFQQYVIAHLNLIKSTKPDPANADFVIGRQKAYDVYSAARDPATGLFCAMFGNEWANDFVHDFLFSMSDKPKAGSPPPMPFMGGGAGGPPRPPQQQQQQQVVEQNAVPMAVRR